MNTLRRYYLSHHSFFLVLILFVAFRVMALLLYKPGGYIFGWNDYYFFKDWASFSNQGLYPYLDFWMEHPPLFSWLVILSYKLSLLAPAYQNDLLWFSITFGLTLLPFEVGNLVLIYAIVLSTADRPTAVVAAWIYSALYLPVFFWTAGFDCYPLFFLLLSLYFAIKSRPAVAGVATGLGFMIKVVPAVAGPVILMAMAARTKSKALTYCLVTGAVILLVSAPFALANPTMFVASFRSMLSRSSWETVWALLDGYYGSGRGVASPAARLDTASATITHHTSSLPWMWITIAFGLILVIAITRKIDWNSPRKVVAITALALNLFILYSKGYSPQFVVYPLAFIVILFPNGRGVIYSLLLSAINIAEYPIALIFFDELEWLVATTIILRTFLIIVLSAEYMAIVFEGYLARMASLYLPAAASIVIAILMGLSVLGAGQLAQRSISSSTYRELIEFLEARPSATVLFTDNGAFEQLYAFLWRRHDVRVIDGKRDDETEGFKGDVWLVYLGSEKDKSEDPVVSRRLAEKAFPVDTIWLSNVRLTRYSAASLELQPVDVKFGNVARLSGYASDLQAHSGDVLHVGLSWQALEKTEKSFKVFLHVVDSQGRVVAQRDTEPVAGLRPTSSWNKGEEILDNHGVALPRDLPTGGYRLLVGLYDSTSGVRLPTSAGSDVYEAGSFVAQALDNQSPLLLNGR